MPFAVSDRQPEMLIASFVNFDRVTIQRISYPSQEQHNNVTNNFWKKVKEGGDKKKEEHEILEYLLA